MTAVEKLLKDLVGLLERRKIDYAVIGGFAVRAHGLPRPTYDVDVTISLDRAELPDLFAAIDELGYDVGDQCRGGWVDKVADMPLFKASTFVNGRTLVADIFVAESDFQLSLIRRRTRETVDDIEMWIASVEDLLLLKLVANRPRDLGDVQDVLLVQGQLDEAYLREWAVRLEVLDRLEKARQDFQD